MDKKFEPYFETIRFLEGLQNVPGQKNYMSDRMRPEMYVKRMRYFFELIGILKGGPSTSSGTKSGSRSFKFIHVAGTSGKGSVTAMFHEILGAADKRVGSFTSPFTTTSIEKIRVGDKYISPQELTEIVDELKPHIAKAYLRSPYGGPSYFEIWFAIAIKYFLRKECEWVVLEVGLGGKYDPGVLLPGCVATVLTNVDYDHTQLLGRTLTKIAREKAGIMRPGVPFFTAEGRPHLLRMFEKMGKKKGARVVHINAKVTLRQAQGLNLLSERRRVKRAAVEDLPFIQSQIGMDFQGRNAALTRAVAEYLRISERAIVKGIERARLPCRFEIVQKKPLTVLDGAHSVAKMKATVANLERVKFNKLHLVLAIAANKDIEGICKLIVPRADRVYVTRFDMALRESAHPRDLMRTVKKYARRGVHVEVFMDCRDALSSAISAARVSDLVLVTGSFFLAGELRKRWYSEERILNTRQSF